MTPAACPPDVSGARCGAVAVPLDPADPATGTLGIRFELYRHHDRAMPAAGTIVAVEGGPGYATTASRDGYLELFGPLLDRYDFLLVDNRGTGRSGAIDCPALQSYKGDYERNARRCGDQLGTRSDLYGSALAADDLAAVLDALGIARVHLYGDSDGTFFSQTFAVRHPDRLDTLILDAPYPVEGQDPWYRDAAHAVRDGFRSVCERDLRCAASGEDQAALLARMAERLRQKPLRGVPHDADGVERRVVVDGAALALLANDAGYGEPVYRELRAALHALEAGDAGPLLRLVAEDGYYGDGGPVKEYSEGLYLAVACNDYGTHVMALNDMRRASVIVRRFVRTAEAGDTSCASKDYRFKLVERFARTAAELPPVPGGSGLTLRDRRAISAAASTVLDLVPRWLTMAGYEGVGLRGGAFATDGWEVATFRLDRLRWVKDVAISGRAAWDRRTGAIRAAVTLSGPATAPGRLTLRWNELDPDGVAHATGQLGGRPVDVAFPAP